MKSLKFDHDLAKLISSGEKTATWRIFDDKDLSVNDKVSIIDKVDPEKPETWLSIGVATITQVLEKALENVTEQDMVGHEKYKDEKDMITSFQKYYGDKVTGATPVKIVYFDFEAAKPTQASNIILDEAKIYTDGGSRGNPGPSACAYVICKMDDTVVEKSGTYMGLSTNNKAEYQGLRQGLERAKDLGVKKVAVYMDSQLVVNQAKGLFKVRNTDLIAVHQEIMALSKLFEKITFNYIPRELNKVADAEVNHILDEQNRV